MAGRAPTPRRREAALGPSGSAVETSFLHPDQQVASLGVSHSGHVPQPRAPRRAGDNLGDPDKIELEMGRTSLQARAGSSDLTLLL